METIRSKARASQSIQAATATGASTIPRTLTGSIVKFAGCNGSGSLFRSGILRAGGMAFDHSGNLYYVDQLIGIFKCNGPSSCGIFAPIGGSGGLIIPTNINFDNSTPRIYGSPTPRGYIDAVNLAGLIVYILDAIGGMTRSANRNRARTGQLKRHEFRGGTIGIGFARRGGRAPNWLHFSRSFGCKLVSRSRRLQTER